MHRQFTIAVAITIGLVLVSALALSKLMLISDVTAFVVVGSLMFAGVLVVSRRVLTSVVGDVEALRGHRAAEAESTLCNLVADVSHDLRIPTASLRLMTHALDDGPIRPEDHAATTARMRIQIDVLSVLADELCELDSSPATPHGDRVVSEDAQARSTPRICLSTRGDHPDRR